MLQRKEVRVPGGGSSEKAPGEVTVGLSNMERRNQTRRVTGLPTVLSHCE